MIKERKIMTVVCSLILLCILGFAIIYPRIITFNEIKDKAIPKDEKTYSIILNEYIDESNSQAIGIDVETKSYDLMKKDLNNLKLFYLKKEKNIKKTNPTYTVYITSGKKHFSITVNGNKILHDDDTHKSYYILDSKNTVFDDLFKIMEANSW